MTQDLNDIGDEELIAGLEQTFALDAVFSQLYARHRSRVIAWCLRILRDEQDAAEVTQDVFMKVHAELRNFRGQSRFTTWLYVLVRRAALDRLRKNRAMQDKAARVALEPATTPAQPGETLEAKQSSDDVRQVIARVLDAREAQVVYMHYALGMSLPAIAKTLALSNASGAKAPLVAALRKLRRHYGDTAETLL